jgi:hypothetical protein
LPLPIKSSDGGCSFDLLKVSGVCFGFAIYADRFQEARIYCRSGLKLDEPELPGCPQIDLLHNENNNHAERERDYRRALNCE